MPASIKTLKVSVKQNELDVNDPKLKIDASPDPILIIWDIKDANDPGVIFESWSNTQRYFEWQAPGPPPGVFSEPMLSADGKRIVIDDCHLLSSGGEQEYIYKLRARDASKNKWYETLYSIQASATQSSATKGTQQLSALVRDPTIINK